MDRDVRAMHDSRDVLPRLADRFDATGSRVHRVFDTVDPAQSLLPPPPHLQDTQQLHPLQPPPSASASFQSSSRHYFQQHQHQQHQQPPQPQPQPQPQPDNHFHTHRPPHNPAVPVCDLQDTTSSTSTAASTDADQLFTPPISEGEPSVGGGGSGSVNGSGTGSGTGSGNGSGNGSRNGNAYGIDADFSSQESQLMQLSELAAASARMGDANASDVPDLSGLSRKRTADGDVKHARNPSSASHAFHGGHSRNTSTVSVASTVGSRIGELSAELKAKLSYAMVKVNNGWQAHTIDQVESFASRAASPTSSTSTIHGRRRMSASPHLSGMPGMPGMPSHKRQLSQASQISQASASTAATVIGSTGRIPATLDMSLWPSQNAGRALHAASPPLNSPLAVTQPSTAGATRSLAPPASIQPSRPVASARRHSNSAYASAADPIIFSPHQNVREQDAIETLLFMSSPGNSANMKRFPSSQPLPAGHHELHHIPHQLPPISGSPQRHALPSGPRKNLPTARPPSHRHSQSLSQPSRRGHLRSPSEMDMDEPFGTPGTPRRRDTTSGHPAADAPASRLKIPLSVPSGLSGTSKPRPALGEDDIEKMLDRAAAASADDSSDSDSEILIPVRRTGQVGI